MGLGQDFEPVEGLGLEPSDIFFVFAVLVHDAAGARIGIHSVHVVIFHAKRRPEVDAGVVHLAVLRCVSAKY